jgi:hypothetical protein
MCSQVRGVVRNFIWGAKPPPLGQRWSGIHSPCP